MEPKLTSFAALAAGNCHAMDLVGTVNYSHRAIFAPEPGDRGVIAHAHSAYNWIARSSTFITILAAITLISAISCRAARLPTVSINHAAFITNNLVASISIRESAIHCCTLALSAR